MKLIVLKDDKLITIEDDIEALQVISNDKLVGRFCQAHINPATLTGEIYTERHGTIMTHGSDDSDLEVICRGIDNLAEVTRETKTINAIWKLSNKIDDKFGRE